MHSTRKLLVVAAAILSLAALVPSVSAASPRSGDLHVTKECSQYTGAPGGYCTVTSSNIAAIAVGSKIIYRDALTFPITDTDLVLDLPGPGNNMAFGHVTEDLVTGLGVVTLRSGTGLFTWFRAAVAVTPNAAEPFGYSWDGTYSFTPGD